MFEAYIIVKIIGLEVFESMMAAINVIVTHTINIKVTNFFKIPM
jgi:hypothetical protein